MSPHARARIPAGICALGFVSLLMDTSSELIHGLLPVFMVAHVAPGDITGTPFGLFNVTSGLAMLVASALAGLLWDMEGAAATFLAGAAFSTVALALVILHGVEDT